MTNPGEQPPEGTNPPAEHADPEVTAITQILAALKPLDDTQRNSVMEYVLKRVGLTMLLDAPALPPAPGTGRIPPPASPPTPPEIARIHDIRTLKETKNPKSANEMAALVAYYLSELAPEKRKEINKEDIERQFKAAGFRLSARSRMTLVNAKNAGYLDTGSAEGLYKLNPVGYNLVVHRLPADSKKEKGKGRRSRPAAKKKAKGRRK
jgi:hypothetical protein